MLDRLRKWHLAADLLVASEDMALTDGIFSYFEPLGYHLENCASDMDLLDAVSQNDYAVIILDAALTDSLGIPMFIRLRSNGYTVPIILLAQNVTPKKEANFVSAGVDCVVPLPLHHLELETKLLALLRLVRGHTSTRLFWEGIELDMRKHEVACDGKPIHFPPMCFKVMAILPRRDMEQRVASANKAIAEALKPLGITLIDDGSALMGRDGKIDESCFRDGLHPNEKGYGKIVKFICK